MRDWVISELWQPLRAAVAEFQQDRGSVLAAAVAYYAALSFFPLLLVVISGVGYFLRFTQSGQDAQHELLNFIASSGNPEIARGVGQLLAEVQGKAAVNGPIGLATLLIGAIAIFTQFEWSFDQIWNVPNESKGWLASIKGAVWDRLKAFLMLLGVGLLVIVSFLAGMTLSTVSRLASDTLPVPAAVWTGAQLLLAITLNTLLFTAIYKVLPKLRIEWADALRGGLLAAVIWEIGRQLLAAFLVGNKFGAYGLVGSFLAILLWIYYVAALLFFGAEFVQVLHKRRSAVA